MNETPAIVPAIESRDFFPKVLNASGLAGEGVEIGVLKGEFSDWILEHWQGQRLHSVDPWMHFGGGEYVDGHNLADPVHDVHFQITRERLAKYGERSKIHRMTSAQAAPLFADGSLDFVYLDAQHHYEAVREDIALWWPKVKAGGILGGHDFFEDGDYPFGRFGVKKAVMEFAASLGMQILVSAESAPLPFQAPSWFVVKPVA